MSQLSPQAYRGLLVALGYRVASANEFQRALFAKQPLSVILKRVIIDAMARRPEGQEVIDALEHCGHTLSARALKRFKVMIGGYGNLDARAALREILPLLQGACVVNVGLMTGLMGAYASYELIAASGITNTGSSVITGDIANDPGDLDQIIGFGTFDGGTFGAGAITTGAGIVHGAAHGGDATSLAAQAEAHVAYLNLRARIGSIDKTGIDLGTLTLGPGVYHYDTSAQLTGTLVLDAQGDANAQWIFQIGTTLTTATSAEVSIINGGTADNVAFVLGSNAAGLGGSATLGTSTIFRGNIVAGTAITVVGGAGASVDGRLLVGGSVGTGAAITFSAITIAGH